LGAVFNVFITMVRNIEVMALTSIIKHFWYTGTPQFKAGSMPPPSETSDPWGSHFVGPIYAK